MSTKSCRQLTSLAALILLLACQPTLEDHLVEARAFIEAGHAQLAVDSLSPIVSDDPTHPEANYLLGVALASEGEFGRAIWPLDRARRFPDFEQPAHRWLAFVLLEQSDPESALEASTRAVELDATDALASRIRFRAMLATNDCDRVVEETKGTMETKTTAADSPVMLEANAIGLECLGRDDEALNAWRRLMKSTAGENWAELRSTACLNVARLVDAMGRPDEAAAVLEECIADHSSPAQFFQVATQHRANGRLAESERVFRLGLTKVPGHTQLAGGLAALLDAGGDANSALDVLTQAAEARPSVSHWTRVASFARARGDAPRARSALEHAIDSNPKSADAARFALVDLLISNREIEAARAQTKRLGDDAMRALAEGAIHLIEGDAERALSRLDAGLAQWPGNAGARFMAGEAARSLGRNERAISEYRAALRSDLSETLSADRLADLLVEKGKSREALATVVLRFEASAGSAVDSPARQNLAHRAGRLAFDLGEAETAIGWFERCLALGETHVPAANDLAWLLASEGRDLERALELAERANDEGPSEATLDTLEFVRRRAEGSAGGTPIRGSAKKPGVEVEVE